jgi:hypothetical protein
VDNPKARGSLPTGRWWDGEHLPHLHDGRITHSILQLDGGHRHVVRRGYTEQGITGADGVLATATFAGRRDCVRGSGGCWGTRGRGSGGQRGWRGACGRCVSRRDGRRGWIVHDPGPARNQRGDQQAQGDQAGGKDAVSAHVIEAPFFPTRGSVAGLTLTGKPRDRPALQCCCTPLPAFRGSLAPRRRWYRRVPSPPAHRPVYCRAAAR